MNGPSQYGHTDRPAGGFGRRIAMYLVGVAIGCLILGWFSLQKSRSAQTAPAEQRQGAPAAPSQPSP